MNKIAVYLNRHLTGNVYDKPSILAAYSTDASALTVKPRFVAVPESTSDLRKIVRFSNQLAEKKYPLPLAVRGAGLSRTGADLSSGLVISMDKLNRLRELDSHDRLVHVQAGLTLGELNTLLAPHGLTLPIAASPHETIGGLISNAPRDKYTGKYGGILNYVDRLEVVLSNGDLLQTSRLSRKSLNSHQRLSNLEGEIYTGLEKILLDNYELIDQQGETDRFGYPGLRHVRRLGGKIFDLMPAFFGAEGSLGIITEAILRLEPIPARPHRLFAVFNTIKPALDFADFASSLAPLSVDLYDTRIFAATEASGKKPSLLTRKLNDEGYLVLVSFNDRSRLSRKKITRCLSFLPKSAYVVTETLKNSEEFDLFDSALRLFLNDSKGDRANILNDFYLPPDRLASFLSGLKEKETAFSRPLEIYGSLSTGIFSLRPDFKLSDVNERRQALTLMRDLNDLLQALDGNLAGGYPEGRLKSIVMYPTLDKERTELIKSVKRLFDPNSIFAPCVKSLYDTRSTVRHLRTESSLGINE